jgi:cellobiose-specific phosphotransferase system component IIC
MEPTTEIERTVPTSPALWPIILAAFIAALIVGEQVLDRWGTSDLYGKVMSIVVLVILVFNPMMELWRRRSGKDVRFSHLATSGYTLVWIVAYLLTRHSR